MLEVTIGDLTVDAGDFEAVMHAALVAVKKRNGCVDDYPDSATMLEGTLFAVQIALGSLCLTRGRTGLRDTALEFLQQEIGSVIDAKEDTEVTEEQPVILSA